MDNQAIVARLDEIREALKGACVVGCLHPDFFDKALDAALKVKLLRDQLDREGAELRPEGTPRTT